MKKTAFEDALKVLAARQRQELGGHPLPDHLLAYHMGELQPEEIDRVQDHLAICGECAQFVLSLGTVGKPSVSKEKFEVTAGQVAQAWQDFRNRLDMPDAGRPSKLGRKEATAALPWALRPQFAYLIAASLLVVTGWLAFKLANGPPQFDGVAQLYENSTRSATDPVQILSASSQNTLLLLTALQEIPSYSSYSADVVDEEGRLIGQTSDPVRLQESFFLQLGQLDPGSYQIRLYGIQDQTREHIADFEFLVR